jgi:thioesterase domain-containing protein
MRPMPSVFPGSIADQARRHIQALRKLRLKGPYLLGGFCVDALVAHEMACQLVRDGEIVDSLILIDPPVYPGIFRLTARILRSLADYSRMHTAASIRYFRRCLSVREVFAMNHSERTQYILQRLRRTMHETLTGNRLDRAATQQIEEFAAGETNPDILSAHLWSAALYSPKKFSGTVHLFVSSELMKSPHCPVPQWRNLAHQLDIHEVPGEHLGTITRYVEILGQKLRSCLKTTAVCAPSGRLSECLLSAS